MHNRPPTDVDRGRQQPECCELHAHIHLQLVWNSMSHSQRSVHFLAAVVLLAGCISLSGSPQSRPSLMEAARQPILTFATALAANGIPAGVLVPQSAFKALRGTLPGPSE